MEEACCTCAALLSTISPQYDEQTEKPKTLDRRLQCCGRVICGSCISNNPRFSTHCPFCQVSIKPCPLPSRLRDPPAYKPPSASIRSNLSSELPPSYSDDLPSYCSPPDPQVPRAEKSPSKSAEDVLHFLNHEHDSLQSLSLRYGVPISVLRRSNNISSDHLLHARRTVVIPGEYYQGGVSLSPRPVEGEGEERRKATVRRWMVACKVSEYDVALLYLEQAHYDLGAAIAAYKEDEIWEKEHPIDGNMNGKGKSRQVVGRRRFIGRGHDNPR
ncbi:hypothetical protein OIDMADRAFT_134847 [Oidiodendron maius Zn]|uniref:LysM domain-containing protein n=1 Tax=Oidiodendron maius (strain Zn) TaxID=913774 RepID=A0A0C3CZE1_OIDMZ|nr:hypothetical protein OIDMADRAFT_134847 [Oidiodendron maius Zn]